MISEAVDSGEGLAFQEAIPVSSKMIRNVSSENSIR